MRIAWWGLGVFLVVGTGFATASERSERLVARGEVAYQEGRYDEARVFFEEAAEADPEDAVARYQLGLALGRLGRWGEAVEAFEYAHRLRPDFEEASRALDFARTQLQQAPAQAAPTVRRWQLRATTGFGYDTNVKVAPDGRAAVGVGDRDDVGFILSGGGQYDVVQRPDALLRLEYDLYQTLHPDISDFDFRSQRVRGTASYQLLPVLWAGLQGGYNYYTLGSDSYESEPYVMPFGSLLEGERGITQLSYRHGHATYLSSPFHDVRDGPNDAVTISQTINFGPRFVSFGFLYGQERPRPSAGADYSLDSYQEFVGFGVPLWWQTQVDVTYLFRYDHYLEPNSYAGFRTRRYDVAHEFSVALTRPVAEHVELGLLYYGTLNGSNIDIFQYDRHIVSTVLQVTY